MEKKSSFKVVVENNFIAPLYSAQKHCGMTNGAESNSPAPRHSGRFLSRIWARRGFTLIELLVVVLIIGILAAVALPKYQKAVEKSRAATVLPLLKSVVQAQTNYYLANGTYATSFDDLAVDTDWTGRETGYHFYNDVRSNEDWSLQLSLVGPANSGLTGETVLITRLRGPYRGGGFSMNIQTQQLLCVERPIFTNTPGSYCEKIFQGTNTNRQADTRTYYLNY